VLQFLRPVLAGPLEVLRCLLVASLELWEKVLSLLEVSRYPELKSDLRCLILLHPVLRLPEPSEPSPSFQRIKSRIAILTSFSPLISPLLGTYRLSCTIRPRS
jgi:hypothetical protein